ncbi:MAG: hypothetical protein JNL34_17865 [Anaerolineae bacterium]|nr:hypothetical protein [Anaerolineae bacterium]
MAATIEWLLPGRVLRAHFWGEATGAEALAVNDEMQGWIGQDGIAPVHVILDLTGLEQLPPNIRGVMSKMRVDHPQKSGWTMVVGGSPAIRFIAAVTAQVLRQKVRLATSVDDACAFLRRADLTLPPASSPAPPAGTAV